MEEDLELGRKGKFARCIICSDYSLRTQCYNIFNTTLENGKILLSEFLKNVLDCSVFIVVSPDFFICKRCFILCHNLDCSLARCNDLQGKIQTMFKITERKLKTRQKGEMTEEDFNKISLEADMELKEEIKDELPYEEGEIEEEEYYEDTPLIYEEVDETRGISQNSYLPIELVESEITVADTEYPPVIEQPVTQIPIEQPQNHECVKEEVLAQEESSQDGAMCEKCGLYFENKQLLKAHKDPTKNIKSYYEFQNYSVKLKKKKKVFFCNRCKYEGKSPEDIAIHLNTHKTDPVFMCDICGRRFKFLKTFNRHKEVHDESRPFACKFCTFRAMTEVLLRIHERQHDEQKKYMCTKCNYKTVKKMSYIIHCRKHTGERPYCCPTCPYKAKDPSTLERHRRIHGGIRRYQCTICDYKGTQKAALTMHMKIHTGEKPYACDQCDYRSSARHNLKAHIAAIHCDETPFACVHCDYKTKLKRQLKYHMRKHSGEKPYGCPYCECRFRYRSAMTYHVSKKHTVAEDGSVLLVMNYCQAKKVKISGEDLVFSDGDDESGSDGEVQVQVS